MLLLLFYSIFYTECNILSRFPCAFLHILPLFLFHCIVKPFLLIFTILFICHFVPHIYKKKPSLKFSTKLFPYYYYYYYYCVCVGIKNNKKRKKRPDYKMHYDSVHNCNIKMMHKTFPSFSRFFPQKFHFTVMTINT